MTGTSRLLASAAVGGLMLLAYAASARAQRASAASPGRATSRRSRPARSTASSTTSAAMPVAGAMVSALGATTAFAVTDRERPLRARARSSPGPYLVRAHLGGYRRAARDRSFEVRAERARVLVDCASPRAPRRRRSGARGRRRRAGAADAADEPPTPERRRTTPSTGTDRRRSQRDSPGACATRAAAILKDVDDARRAARRRRRSEPDRSAGRRPRPRGRLAGARRDQLLRRHAVLRPGQSADDRHRSTRRSSCSRPTTSSRSIAYVALGAPVGEQADWTVRGALTQARYLVVDRRRLVHDARAGAAPLRRRPVVQHAALRRRQLRSRCATSPTAAGTPARSTASTRFTVTPAVTLTYGGALRALRLPRRPQPAQPARRADASSPPSDFRVSAVAVAPRARARRRGVPAAGRQRHLAAAAAHVLVARSRPAARGRAHDARRSWRSSATSAASTVVAAGVPPARRRSAGHAVRRRHARTSRPRTLGHYFVGNAGDVDATRLQRRRSGRRSPSRVHGSVEYSLAQRAR